MKTRVPQVNLNALIVRPMPSYVAGVDLGTEDVYLVPCFDTNSGYGGSIPTNNKLINAPKSHVNNVLLQQLKNDVTNYWKGLNVDNYKPLFQSKL